MNRTLIAGIIVAILSIAIIVVSYFYGEKYIVHDAKNEKQCNSTASYKKYCKDSSCCLVWDDDICRIGKYTKGKLGCHADKHDGPAIVAIVGLSLLVVSIILLVMGIL